MTNFLKNANLQILIAASFCIFLAGCSTTGSTSFANSPKAVVRKLMPVAGHYVNFTRPSEVETIKNDLSPELFDTLIAWTTALGKAEAATSSSNNDAQMMLPVGDNVFFGQSVIDGNPPLVETIKGTTAEVAINTTLTDTDGKTILRRTKNTFLLVQQDGAWRVRDVNRVEVSFPFKKPFQYDLLDGLKGDIGRFKKMAGGSH